MAVYTSNYARKGKDPGAIAISRKPPPWFKGRHMPEFAPTWDMIMDLKNGIITEDEYTVQYIMLLEKNTHQADFDEPNEALYNFIDGTDDPTYFLCYESPTDFCHRHLFSMWIEEKTGWVIPEWKNEREIESQRQQNVVDSLLEF